MHVVLESDSRTYIEITVKKDDYSEIRLITLDVKALSRSFLACSVNFMTKRGNNVAYAVTIKGLKSTNDPYWVENAPLGVIDLIASDYRFIEPP